MAKGELCGCVPVELQRTSIERLQHVLCWAALEDAAETTAGSEDSSTAIVKDKLTSWNTPLLFRRATLAASLFLSSIQGSSL